ncbi:MAG: o-succinylbenzoate synthase [Deltaproteobacteria bacterium]|nr:MAG: o-succinylbenzoate synthase [Deltaproteobacteria bacterium]
MKIAAARVTPVRLRLRHALETAHGRIRVREGFLLELVAESGLVGCGEALPLPGFGLETADRAGDALRAMAAALRGRDARDPGAALDAIEPSWPGAPCARGAADVALHDLAARLSGRSVAECLAEASPPRAGVPVSALLPDRGSEAVAEAARLACDAGFRTLKLKVGVQGLAADEARVAAARRAAGGEVSLRLDANGAWSECGALRALERLARYGLEFVEQPVPADDGATLARLRAKSPVPIAADEALRDPASAARLIACEAADVFVIKPAVVGGLRAAGRIAADARAAGVDVVVTSFLDSALGVAAALQLAAALPTRRAHGLATGALLLDDLAAPLPVRAGWLERPAGPGLGVAPDPGTVRRRARAASREIDA